MGEKGKQYLRQLKEGILDNNPALIQLLGLCPTLAVTTSVNNAFGMGMAATAVLICSNLFISLLRKFIPKQVRIAAYIVIISGFVTAVELLMKAYLPELDRALGLFIPLIVVNCIILARAEAFASKNGPVASVVDGLSMGLGFTFALMLIASVREILGAGSFWGIPLFGENFRPALIFIMPPGAFLTLGFILAGVQKIRNTLSDRRRMDESDPDAGEEENK
ncbi:MAG: electron transport complex subunit E [Ruminococcaceae bacterium]|nr:electron transport complex subunit E [Oscillospiraceae bacterium]